jgi:uncharacterized DUF497 family protein
MQIQEVAGFDWDSGNKSKCQKHGVLLSDIESAFNRTVSFFPDLAHSQNETRYIAIGNTEAGRNLFVSFTLRQREGKTYIRPVSARYMHRKEVEHYEKTITNPHDR